MLHYIFASWKNIVASGKRNSCKKQHGNSVTGRTEGCHIRLPKEKACSDARLCAKGGDNESSRRFHRGSRKNQACRDVVLKGRFTLELAGKVDLTEKKGSDGQRVGVLWKWQMDGKMNAQAWQAQGNNGRRKLDVILEAEMVAWGEREQIIAIKEVEII